MINEKEFLTFLEAQGLSKKTLELYLTYFRLLDFKSLEEEGNKYLILKTLERFGGNKTRAAEALGITTRTIRNKLAEYRVHSQDSAS